MHGQTSLDGIIDETIDDIYESITNPSEWEKVLKSLDLMTRSSCSALISTKSHHIPHYNRPSTVDAERFTEYQSTFLSKDNVADYVRRVDPGQVISSTEFLGSAGAKQSTVYREFYAECGFLHFIGANLAVKSDDWISIVCFRGPEASPYDAVDRTILERIVSHAVRSVQVSQHIAEKDSRTETVLSGFDLIHHAAFLVDPEYRVVGANALADALIETGDMDISHDRRLTIAVNDIDMRRARDAASSARRQGAHSDISGLFQAKSGRKLAVTVADPSEYRGRRVRFTTPSRHRLVLVFDVDARFAATIEEIRREFGLTNAERRVYEASLYHSSSDRMAEALCISRETVRTHLKNIFSKSGISRHVDLIQQFVHRAPINISRQVN